MATGTDKRRKQRSREWQPRDPAQFKRFIEAARAVGVEMDEKAVDKALRAIARQKPKHGND